MLLNKFRKFVFDLLFIVVIVLLGFQINGCNDKPTDIGMPLLFDTITVLPYGPKDSSIFTGQRSFFKNMSIFNVGVIFVGKTEDTKAATILRFAESTMPDSLNYLDASQIISATLTLNPYKYTFGNTKSNNLSFKLYKVRSGNYWSNQATWDSVYNQDGSPKIFESSSIGQWSGQIPMIDTIPAINVQITDFSFIQEWIKNAKDSVPIWGLGILPDDNSDVIHQFVGSVKDNINISPSIKIIYKNKNKNALDSLIMRSAINASFTKAPQIDTTTLAIQGASSWRSQLFFDMSKLPKNASIYKAQLELTYNPDKTVLGNLPVDSVLDAGLFLSDSIWKTPDVPYYASLQGNKYIFPKINSSIEFWLRHSGKGSLVLVSPGWSEYFKLDRVSFYGINETDITKRPKLIVIYSKRPY